MENLKEVCNDKTEEDKVVDVGMKWDDEKKAYFPNIDDEFIYRYNLNYGFVQEESVQEKPVLAPENVAPTSYPEWYICLQNDFLNSFAHEDITKMSSEEYTEKWNKFYFENAKKYEKKKIKPKKKLNKPESQDFFVIAEDKIKHIYVANLPLDITLEEFIELVSKYGMLMYEPFTNIPKAKLYRDKDGNIKGDGICCYLKVESVDLALNYFDGYNLRGNILTVSKAKFESKDDYVPKKKRKITNKEKRKLQKQQEGLFRWDVDTKTIRPKKDNTVIIKNAFDTELMKNNPDMSLDLKEKMCREAKNIGAFKSILVHDLHPEAVIQINFQNANFSDIAVAYFKNKIWNGRKITAEIWDGKTKYKVKETDDEEKTRLENWEKALGGGGKEDAETVEPLSSKGLQEHTLEDYKSLEKLVNILENNCEDLEEAEEQVEDASDTAQEENENSSDSECKNNIGRSNPAHLLISKNNELIIRNENSEPENFDKL